MKRSFRWVGITTAALFVCLEAASLAANNQPSLTSNSIPNANLLAQRSFGTGGFGRQAVRVPIEGRSGGVPVIAVTFNGNRRYPMLVDTGASITTITPQMAKALGFRQEDKIRITVANGRSEDIPVGRVRSIEVGGLVLNRFPVAVTSTPLLGQNFFSEYNVNIGQNFVTFRPRFR